MATGGLNAFRENAVYIGAAKESVWGTGVAPTWFWYWLDGSDANPEPRVKQEMEGDASPYEAITWKQGQYEVIKIVEYGRPIMAGYALQALCGTGSDAFTGATQSSTLNASVVAGATSFTTVASIGNVGASVPYNFDPGYANALYEVLLVNAAGRTGTGPYTYPLVAGQAFNFAHAGGAVVNNASTHVFTRKLASFDPYTIEVGWNTDGGTLQQAFRYLDAVCVELRITSTKGERLKFESTWWSTQALKISTFSAISQETNFPFTHFDASGQWKLNSLATLNALTIENFSLTLHNTTVAEDCQSEALNPVYFLPSNIQISGQYTVVFNDWGQYYLTYWANRSPATNAQDIGSFLVGQEAFSTIWQKDGINSLQISLPNIAYAAAKLPQRLDGKAVRLPVTFRAINNRPSGIINPFTATLSNSQNSAY